MPTSCIYLYAKQDFLSAKHDLSSGSQTFKVLLVKDTYTPDRVAHRYVSDILSPTNYEICTSGTNNYVRKTLTTRTLTVLTGEIKIGLSADNLAWNPGIAASVPTIGGAVIYRDRGGADSANELLFFIDLSDQAPNNGEDDLNWATYVFKW